MKETAAREPLLTTGVDVGARSVKIAILAHHEPRPVILSKVLVPIHGRLDAHGGQTVIRESWNRALADAGLSAGDIDYVVSTGACEGQWGKEGRSCDRSSHAIGARLLFPDAVAALDIGTTQIRCALVDEPPESNRYVLTRPTPDGAKFRADAPFQADLAAGAVGFLKTLATEGKVVLTGGMVLDADFVRSLWSHVLESDSRVSLLLSPDSIFAGAYGAAILAARRFSRISQAAGPVADPAAHEILHIERRMLN